MIEKATKCILVTPEVWQAVTQLKIDKKLRSNGEVVRALLQEAKK